jgi:hypothetical protein
MLIEMRSLAAEGYVIIKDAALQRYQHCRAQIEQELELLRTEDSRDGARLTELLKISAALREEYITACDDVMEATI